MDLEKKYFPDGCPLCGNEVKLEKEYLKYICYRCNAYAKAHRDDTRLYRKYQPIESMAGNETHILRDEVRDSFSKLFRERRYVQGENGMIGTSIINIVYPEHLVKEKINNRETFYRVVHGGDISIVAKSMDKGELVTLSASMVEPVSNRDKAMVYLADKLGLDLVKVNIGFFSESQLKQASGIIHKAIKFARAMSMETY